MRVLPQLKGPALGPGRGPWPGHGPGMAEPFLIKRSIRVKKNYTVSKFAISKSLTKVTLMPLVVSFPLSKNREGVVGF